MKLIDYIRKELANSGLFDTQVDELMPRIINHESMSLMLDRWGDSIDGYPAGMLVLNWRIICPIVLSYIDETCPQAWFRPMFDHNDPIHKMTPEQLAEGTAKFTH